MHGTAYLLTIALSWLTVMTMPTQQRLHRLLYHKGRAIGQPYSCQHESIRMVRVDSEREGYELFLLLCGNAREITMERKGEEKVFHFQNESMRICYTTAVKPGTYETGVVYLNCNDCKIKELHFVGRI